MSFNLNKIDRTNDDNGIDTSINPRIPFPLFLKQPNERGQMEVELELTPRLFEKLAEEAKELGLTLEEVIIMKIRMADVAQKEKAEMRRIIEKLSKGEK